MEITIENSKAKLKYFASKKETKALQMTHVGSISINSGAETSRKSDNRQRVTSKRERT